MSDGHPAIRRMSDIVRGSATAPTPREVPSAILDQWVKDGIWPPEGCETPPRLVDAIRSEYAAITRREPLDVERVRLTVLALDHIEPSEAWLRDFAAEYARLEAADKP